MKRALAFLHTSSEDLYLHGSDIMKSFVWLLWQQQEITCLLAVKLTDRRGTNNRTGNFLYSCTGMKT